MPRRSNVSRLHVEGAFTESLIQDIENNTISIGGTQIRPLSKILREEEDDAFTVAARFDIVWKIVERAFAGEWDWWDGMDAHTKYSSKFHGDVYLFDEFHPSEDHMRVKKCFILKIEATKEEETGTFPELFLPLQAEDVQREECLIEEVEMISPQRFNLVVNELQEIKENMRIGHENIFHSVKA